MKKWNFVLLLGLVAGLCVGALGCGEKSSNEEEGDAGPPPVSDVDSDTDTADTGGERCGDVTCSGHGTCTESGGVVTCACDEGYAGDDCSECAEGYKKDIDDSCIPVVVADLQEPEAWCDELVQVVCSNIMGCCTAQDIAVLQNLLTNWLMPDYWRNGTVFLTGITANALSWKNTADCNRDLMLVCQHNYDWYYYALAMGRMTVNVAAANACLAELLAPAGVCYKVGAMIDAQGLCNWANILVGQQAAGAECDRYTQVAPMFALQTKAYPQNWGYLGQFECANAEGSPTLVCGDTGTCYAKRQEGESCTIPGEGDGYYTTRECDVENDLYCTGRIHTDELTCQHVGAEGDPCYPWLFDHRNTGCQEGLACDGWSAVDTETDPSAVTPGTCVNITPNQPWAELGQDCRQNLDGDKLPSQENVVDCISPCAEGLICTTGTCSNDSLRECWDNEDCDTNEKARPGMGRCATTDRGCYADCDCKHCSVTLKGCDDDFDCGHRVVIEGDYRDGDFRTGLICDNAAPLSETGEEKYECVDYTTDCQKACKVSHDVCLTNAECGDAGVVGHCGDDWAKSCAAASDCPVCSNNSDVSCVADGGVATNCPSRQCVGNDNLTCTSNDDCQGFECEHREANCAGYCGGLLMEHGTYGCDTAADCYICSLDFSPCNSDDECYRRGGDTENNRCINANIPCVTTDTCEAAPTCVTGECLDNSCTAATACVAEKCVTETCGPNSEGVQPGTCQNRKCVDASSYHVGYCNSGAELVNPGYYDLMYY